MYPLLLVLLRVRFEYLANHYFTSSRYPETFNTCSLSLSSPHSSVHDIAQAPCSPSITGCTPCILLISGCWHRTPLTHVHLTSALGLLDPRPDSPLSRFLLSLEKILDHPQQQTQRDPTVHSRSGPFLGPATPKLPGASSPIARPRPWSSGALRADPLRPERKSSLQTPKALGDPQTRSQVRSKSGWRD